MISTLTALGRISRGAVLGLVLFVFTAGVAKADTVAPLTLIEGPAAGADNVVVTPSSGSPTWTNTANASWLHVAANSSYFNNHLQSFTFDANTGPTRTGTLRIDGVTITVTQLGSTFVQTPGVQTLVTSTNSIEAMAADAAGNVYFSLGDDLQKWTAATNTVSTLVDASSFAISLTSHMTIGPAGDVYIADRLASAILKYTVATSTLSNLGITTSFPTSVAVDAAGNVYYGDSVGIRRWTAANGSIGSVISQKGASGLALDAKGNLYYSVSSDFVGGPLLKKTNLTSSGNLGAITGTTNPRGLAIDSTGHLYIADADNSTTPTGNSYIRRWDPGLASLATTIAVSGLLNPRSVAFDGNGTMIFADSGNHQIKAMQRAFVDTNVITVPNSASSSSLTVYPSTTKLTGAFAPTSDQPWISITSATGGNVSFSVSSSASARYGYVNVLGQQLLVQQGTPALATVGTANPENLTPISATLHGNVANDGGSPVTERGFYYGEFNGGVSVWNSPGAVRVTSPLDGGAGFNANISGLIPNRLYVFAAFATTSAGTRYFESSFTTPVATFPSVTGTTVTDLTNGSVTIGGTMLSVGNTPITARGVVYARASVDSNPAVGDANVTVINAPLNASSSFSVSLDGLLPSTDYAFRVFVTNSAGSAYALGQVGFTTYDPTFTLGASSLINGAASGTDSVVLGVAPSNATWTASSDASWLHVDAGSASGTGSALITFTFDANTGATRTGTLTIGGQTLTVTQAPSGYVAVNRATQLGTSFGSQTGGVAVDASGNVFADPSNGTLMRWTPASNAWTQIGTSPVDNQSHLAADAAGNVFISAGPGNLRRLDKWTAPSGPVSVAYPNAGTPGIIGFYSSKIATDSKGNVWLLDGSIYRYNPTTNVKTSMFNVLANNGATSLALDAADNVYVGLRNFYNFSYSVMKWNATTGATSIVIPEYNIAYPHSISVDGSGNVYVSLADTGTIVKWTTATNTLSTVLTGLTPPDSGTGSVRVGQITVDRSGNLYVANNDTIVELPRVFVPGSQILVGTAASSATLPAVIPSTALGFAPFTPSAADSWLHIDSNTAGSVGYSWDASSAARYSYLNIGGQRILVLQGSAATPSISAPTANSISTLLDFSGNVTSDGGAPITARGFALALTSDNTNPQIGGTGVVVLNDPGTALGSYTARATGISPNTRYTFTAFATNNSGTAYSAPITLLTNALDLSLNLNSTGPGTTAVQQPDGMTVIYSGGYLTRYQTDNTIDYSLFVYLPTGTVNAMLSLSDGSLVVGGSFTDISSTPRNNIAKYGPSGNVTDFAPNVNGIVRCMTLQRDGNILIGGDFTQVNGIARNRIARLYPNGTLDLTFNPNANGPVRTIAEQPDGKLLLGGDFTLIGTALCNRLARISTLGVVDATFVASADAVVNAITLQPDNSILVGGGFSTINNIARANLARLNPNGTLDNGFTATTNGPVNSIALQADGKMLLGGSFTLIGSTARLGFARLLANGSVDALYANVTGFDFINGIPKDGTVNGVTLLEDGRIIIAGDIDKVSGAQVQNAARLINDAVSQTLAPTGSTSVEWLRGTTLPEATDVAFDLSTDGGNTWSFLGKGSRIAGGWSLSGLPTLPASAQLRGRARTVSGLGNGSGGWNFVEAPFSLGPPEIAVDVLSFTGEHVDVTNTPLALLSSGVGVAAPTTFFVRNAGGYDLAGITVTILNGESPPTTDAPMFSVPKKPATLLTSGDSTPMVVQAKLTSQGEKRAILKIESTNAVNSPVYVPLIAAGVPAFVPTVSTASATASYNTAHVTGSSSGGSNLTLAFDYGLTTAYTDEAEATSPQDAPVFADLTDLLPHKTYHYRLRASSPLGSGVGVDKTFTTLNHAPVGVADSAVVLRGASASIDVLANDTDADDDALTITTVKPVSPLTAGTVAITGNQLVFTAKDGFTGNATVDYSLKDGFGGTASATLTVSAGSTPTLGTTETMPLKSAAITYALNVTASGSWAVSEAIAWASVSQTKGSGNATIYVTVQANTGTATRSGDIKIGGATHHIDQSGVVKPSFGTLAGSPFQAIVGGYFELALPIVNGPVTYTTSNMPPGLTLSNTTNLITGRPTMAGTTATDYVVVVKASNAAGPLSADTAGKATATLSFTIHVNPLPAGVVGTFHGYVERSATARFTTNPDLGARFEMTTMPNGTVTGSVTEGVTKKSFITGAKIEPSAAAPKTPTLTVAVAGTSLFIDLTFDADNNAATGFLRNVSGLNKAAITSWRNGWNPAKATDYKAQHNFKIENTDTANGPQGYGYGSFIVTEATGALTISGKLPDGSALSGTTFVGQSGEVLLYQALHASRGSCFGKLIITKGASKPADNTLAGSLSWIKPASVAALKDTVYSGGFPLLTLDVKGGTFVPPLKGQRLLGLPDQADNAQLVFGPAGADSGFIQVLRIVNTNNTSGTVNTATFTTKVNGTVMPSLVFGTGVFGGSFSIPGPPSRPAPFFGQIVPVSGVYQGYGFYLLPSTPGDGQTVTTSPKLSGKVELNAN